MWYVGKSDHQDQVSLHIQRSFSTVNQVKIAINQPKFS